MTKSQLREHLREYIKELKDRCIEGYTLQYPTMEGVALRNAELNGAYQAADTLLAFIEENMEEDE